MKKACLISAFLLTLLAMTGCTSTYRDGGAANLAMPASAFTPKYTTQYNISPERISASGEATVVLGIFHCSESKYCLWHEDPNSSFADRMSGVFSPTRICINNAKRMAVYNAVSEKNADLLLGATFEYTVESHLFHTTVTCKVKGFPATVKSVKFPEKRPVILNNDQKIEYVDGDIQSLGVAPTAKAN